MSEEKKKIDEVDKLKLQLAFSFVQNMRLSIEVIQRDMGRAQEEYKKAAEALDQERRRIAAAYGVDLNTTTLDAEGNFVPIDKAKMPFPVGQGV